jgi:hypothetical protein
MKNSTKVISLTCLLLGIPACLYADRAHDLAAAAADQKAVTGCKPATLNTQTCHSKFPTGCTASARAYDAYLNFLKNQVPGSSWTSTDLLDGNSFTSLEGQAPKGLNDTNHASFAPTLAGLHEGNIVTVIAYLYFAEDTSKGAVNGGETTIADFGFRTALTITSAWALTRRLRNRFSRPNRSPYAANQ